MNVSTDLIYDTKRKLLAKYPRFGGEIAVLNIEYRENLKYPTAATDGKNIYVDPKYFESLSENDRLFLIAHEIMHIKFMHMYRLKDKEGVLRNLELWNIATDAVINANLERDGFTIKERYVNMPEAIQYSAEEFYQKLLQEKQNEKQENQESKDSDEQEQDDNGQGNEKNNDQDKKDKTKQQDDEQENIDENAEKDENNQEQETSTRR